MCGTKHRITREVVQFPAFRYGLRPEKGEGFARSGENSRLLLDCISHFEQVTSMFSPTPFDKSCLMASSAGLWSKQELGARHDCRPVSGSFKSPPLLEKQSLGHVFK